MIVHIWYLLPALFLLWFPRKWMRLGRRIGAKSNRRAPALYTEVVDPKDLSLKPKELFKKLRNWIDLLRAAAGATALMAFSFSVNPSLPKRLRYEAGHHILALEIGLLVVAVCMQTVKNEGRLILVAPVFFILGLSFGLIGWKAALFACIVIWAINLVLPSAEIFLLVFAGVELAFGVIPKVGSSRVNVLIGVCMTLIPVLISAATKRRLVELNKKVKRKREIIKE